MDFNSPSVAPPAKISIDGTASIDLPPRSQGEPSIRPADVKPGRIEVDAFLAHAATEYRQGRIDRALWDETAREFDNDKQAAVAAYLRVRARALRRKHREDEQRKAALASLPAASNAASYLSQPRVRYALAGIAMGFVAMIGWWAAFSDSVPEPSTPVMAAARAAGAPPKVAPSNPVPIAALPTPPGRSEAGLELEAKVGDLERSGNFNVLVLYAADWTRKEPDNALAWTSLSGGYRRLGQLQDALDAANRAVKLAPDDVRHWRNLGHVELALDRFPEAQAAFDKVLAANANDAEVLCAASRVANAQSRPKDAAALSARVTSLGTKCEEPVELARATAQVSVPIVQRKPAAAGR